MGLLSRGMAFLGRIGAENEGVSVQYGRTGVFSLKTINAVIGGPGFSQEDNTEIPGRIGEHAVDFIIRVADWIAAGCVGEPKDGDRIVWSNERSGSTVSSTFRAYSGNTVPAWDWGEPERVTYRIHARLDA